jgi:hypothetical protein
VRHESSGERDLTINLWHRASFGDHAKAFDIDLVGMCGRCDQTLYAYEATRSTTFKATNYLRNACMHLNVPGYLVRYGVAESSPCECCRRPPVVTVFEPARLLWSEVSLVVPFQSPRKIGTLDDFKLHLEDLRASHERVWHAASPLIEARRGRNLAEPEEHDLLNEMMSDDRDQALYEAWLQDHADRLGEPF